MNITKILYSSAVTILMILHFTSCVPKHSGSVENDDNSFTGSASCIECHEKFYKLWAPSHHGKAMQPITTDFINTQVVIGQSGIEMEGASYQAIKKDTSLFIQESKAGQSKDYKVLWALGGKNVYYFLTEWEGGRLQTLPLAFDVHTKLWYNNPASAIRHFPSMGQGAMADSALSWRDRQYTFNTSCYACHVSQLKTTSI